MSYDKVNGKVGFIDSTHVYEDVNTKKRYTSVTTVINNYTQPFNSEFWSSYKAIERILGKDFNNVKSELLKTKNDSEFNMLLLDSYNISKEDFIKVREEILQEWKDKNKESTDRGTRIHAELENAMYDAKTNISLKKYGLGGKFNAYTDYEKLNSVPGIYPEYLIYNDTYNIAGQIDLLINDGEKIHIIDYKGLPLNTPIPTPAGFTSMRLLKEGDIVYDSLGNKCKVVHKSNIHHKNCIEFKFDTNEFITSDYQHRWLVENENGISEVLTSEEILNNMRFKEEVYYIINPAPILGRKTDFIIHPYLLGCILLDKDIFNMNISKEHKNEFFKGKNILEEMDRLKISSRKYIPISYLRSGIKQRFDLYNAFYDNAETDEIGKYIDFKTNQEFKNNFLSLIGSLGMKPSIIIENKVYLKTNNGLNNKRKITSAKKVKMVPTQCIEVDSPLHTYQFGYSHIVTHNTNKSIDEKSYFDPKTRKYQMMQYPLNNVMDSNMWHYALQLSTYAFLITEQNPKLDVGILKLHHFPHEGGEKQYDIPYLKNEVMEMLKHFNLRNSKGNRLTRIKF